MCVVWVCVIVSGLCLEGREWVKGRGGGGRYRDEVVAEYAGCMSSLM